jgi:uncharacterized protein (DUF1501 family)
MNRRDVLIGTAGLAGLATLGQLGFARAVFAGQPGRGDRYFVFCYFSGGWDILMSLDPRDPVIFNETNMGSTRIQPAYDQLDAMGVGSELIQAGGLSLGPAAAALAGHADRLALVRGISMDTLTHTSGMRYFLTGRPTRGQKAVGSSMATWLAAMLRGDELMANLVFNMETYNQEQAAWASGARVQNVNDLLRLLEPGDVTLSEAESNALDELFLAYEATADSRRSAVRSTVAVSRSEAALLLDNGLSQYFDLAGEGEEAQQLRNHYGFDANQLDQPEALAAASVLALTRGLGRCISFMPAVGLDTHGETWATTHTDSLNRGFTVVSNLLTDLASREYEDTGESWLDHTTVLAFSEFGRGAMVNANGGRDHSLTNACLLAGAGVRPGVYGASSDLAMEPQAVDLVTGAVDPAGEVIRPGHIFRSLLSIAGFEEDVADLGTSPLQALLL